MNLTGVGHQDDLDDVCISWAWFDPASYPSPGEYDGCQEYDFRGPTGAGVSNDTSGSLFYHKLWRYLVDLDPSAAQFGKTNFGVAPPCFVWTRGLRSTTTADMIMVVSNPLS